MAGGRELVLSAQRDHTTEEPREEDVFRVGTLGAIIQLLRLPDQTVKVLVEGKARVEIKRFVAERAALRRRDRARSSRATTARRRRRR